MSKEINMSGWYKVKFISTTRNKMVMLLTTDMGDYKITLTTQDLKIEMNPSHIFSIPNPHNFPIRQDFHWIAKYMLRPNKWGKEIFNANPQFILKLWELVADKNRMKTLKGIGLPLKKTVKL